MQKDTRPKKTNCFWPKFTIDKNVPIPIYYQIAQLISEQISQNRIGNNIPLPSERGIAKELGVNRGTIRKAYKRLVTEGVIKKEGRRVFISQPQRDRGADTPNTIGLVLPMDLSYYVKKKLWGTLDYISGVMGASKELNCPINLIALPALSKDRENVNKWFASIKAQINGLIYLGRRTDGEDAALEILMTLEIPQVFVSGYCTKENFGAVRADERIGIQAAVEYLIELGHERIAVIGLITEESSVFKGDASFRMEIITSALKESGLEINNDLIVKCKNTEGVIEETVKNLLEQKNPPTAIMSSNDAVAITVMKKVNEIGLRVPDDLSIIGFDDSIQASEIVPALTTIRSPRRMIGKEALRFILKWTRKGERPRPPVRFLSTSLVIRRSTGSLEKVVVSEM